MLESPDFACTLKETKTTIPISRTPKPISGFGLKPGRYRLSAVKVAGFDPLDANHAASTGVGSFPVLDRTCKQGKENTGMRDNQTTRRMPMIVTAMACATASMLAGLALGPSAMAADTTITLQGADGASLAGHTFDVYRIGTYTDQVLDGTRISSLGVRGDTASNAWAADAIGTSLPVGGKNTRAVITGHSNLKGATLFTRLGELEKGDPFYIKVMGNTLAYRVNDIRIVSPTDTKALKIRKGRDEVTLLTCTGQGNTLRLLVTGERNSMPDQAPLPGASPGDTKQAALVSGVTVTGVLAIGFSLCRSRRVSGRHMSC